MSPLSNATTLANYASGIGTQGATLEIDSNNKRVGIGTTNPQGPEGSLQVGTAVTISGNSGIVSATTFHGDFGSSTSVAGNLTVSGVLTYEDVTNIDSVGIITARSDLSIADKIIHSGDTNTAIRFPAADTVTAETSGSERVRITSDGKIGINQITPQTTFHRTGTTNGQQATFGIDDSGLKISTFQKTDNDAGVILDAQKSSNGTLTFATTGTERMRITSAGDIGLGVTPVAGTRLHVQGASDCYVSLQAGSSSGNDGILFRRSTGEQKGALFYDTDDNYFLINVNDGERWRITSGGQVNIGGNFTQSGFTSQITRNSSESDILCLKGNVHNSFIRFQDTDSTSDFTLGSDDGSGAGAGSFVLYDRNNNAYRLYLNSSGNLGIGAIPSRKLTVGGDINVASGSNIESTSSGGTLRVQGGSTYPGGNILLGGGQGTDDIRFRTTGASTSQSERMRIDSSGRLLVATTAARTKYFNTTAYGPLVNFEGNNNSSRIVSFIHNDSSGGPMLILGASGGSTAGNNDLVNSSTTYGFFSFQGTDGTDLVEAARISAEADGTPAANDMPGSLMFYTTADGAATTTERMRINSSGQVYIGGTSGLLGKVSVLTAGTTDTSLHLATTGGSGDNGQATNSIRFTGGTNSRWANAKYEAFVHIFHGNGVEQARIDSAGKLGLGTNSPANALHIKNDAPSIRLESSASGYVGRNTIGPYQNILYIESDNDNAISNSATAFTIDGSEKMRIDSSGRMGLGTISPQKKLHVSDTSGPAQIRITGPSGSSDIYADANIYFQPSGTTRVTMNSAGSLLVGTTSASSFPDRLITAGDHNRQSSYLDIRSSLVGALLFADGTSGNAAYRGQVEYNHSDDSMRLWTAATEKMRIRSDGAVLFNRTSESFLGSSFVQVGIENTNGSYFPLAIKGNTNAILFNQSTNNSSAVGSITMTASATNFNTSSDYRLKENVVAIVDGITRVKQLQPKRFNFIVDSDTTVDGFIAHEAQTVVPEAVTGTKDQVDKDGEAVMQDMDQSKLVPLLTAALQEAIAKIETLETKVAALEG